MGVHNALYAMLARAPVYDVIFACLSPLSLICLARTCRAAYLAVAEFENRAFNINRHLSRYFGDPIAFRSLQAKTSTLISGSNVLQFLDRTFYPESDLDLYTHPGHSVEVAQFLVEQEGYHYSPQELQPADWKVAIAPAWKPDPTERHVRHWGSTNREYPTKDVWTFEKTGANQEHLKVQIIEGLWSPLEAIFGFHSTCVMNFITSEAAYSLYPVATFEDRNSLGLPGSRSSPEAVEKYTKRGWHLHLAPTSNHPAFFLNQVRWVSDKHTWRLPLNQTGVEQRPPLSPGSVPLTCDPVLFNGWKLRIKEEGCADELKGYVVHYHTLQTTLFRYNYVAPDKELQLAISNWVRQRKYRQVAKEDWVWFDAEIPNFLRAV